ncbi:MAG: SPOR domain-containing protein [Pseudomonadota bacterium]
MDTRLKQRVTGAIVLTMLAIIILPMLLDGSEEDRARVIARIPEPPVIELRSLTIREIERNISELEQESAAKLPEAVADTTDYASEPPDQLVLDQNQLPVSWSLQLGSFKSKENALRLRESLREASFLTYIIQAQTDDGEVYRVYVGPMLQRTRLVEIGAEIEDRFDLKGQIVRYRIEDDKGQLGG